MRCVLFALAFLTALPCLADEQSKTDEAAPPKWTQLFDGKSLKGWETAEKWDFKEHGPIRVEDKKLKLGAGKPFTGLRYKGKFPTMDYEVVFEARRVDGNDFFLGVVFPLGEKEYLSFVTGGWRGEVVGLTSIDGEPAIENETAQYVEFENNRWYTIRLRVTQSRVQLWIDKDQLVDFETTDRQLGIYWEQEPLLPFGVSSWKTGAEYRSIRVRKLGADET